MTALHVANLTTQAKDYMFQIGARKRIATVPAAAEIQIEMNAHEIEAFVAQHERYGLVNRDTAIGGTQRHLYWVGPEDAEEDEFPGPEEDKGGEPVPEPAPLQVLNAPAMAVAVEPLLQILPTVVMDAAAAATTDPAPMGIMPPAFAPVKRGRGRPRKIT